MIGLNPCNLQVVFRHAISYSPRSLSRTGNLLFCLATHLQLVFLSGAKHTHSAI